MDEGNAKMVLAFVSLMNAVLASLLTAFAVNKRALPSVQLVFALMVLGNILFFMNSAAMKSPILDSLAVISLYLYGPAIWWLVCSQVAASRDIFGWIHLVPAGAVGVTLTLSYSSDLIAILALLGSVSRLAYGLAGGYELLNNITLLASRQALYWTGAFIVLAVWPSLAHFFYSANQAGLTAWAPIGAVAYINSVIVGAAALLLTWWALIRPEVYLIELSDRGGQKQPGAFDKDVFARLDDLMREEQAYRDDPISLDQIAERLAVTPRELSVAVNRCSGRSFRGYLRRWRISFAKELLSEPKSQHLPILQVAHEAGYATKSTFNVAFKSETGQTPSEFRRSALPRVEK